MKKKRWAIWICCVLALALAACQPRVPGKDGTTDTERILFGGNADYSLVYPSGASDGLKEQVSGLRKTVQALTGGRAETVSDDDAKHPEQDFEILIGLTGRSESRQGYDAVNPSGYRVEWIGNKLVLSGSSDYFVGMAIRELQASWQVADGKITCRRSLSLSGDGAGQVTALLNENGMSNYRLVLPDDMPKTQRSIVTEFISDYRDIFGVRLQIDYASSAPTSEYEILVGSTGRAESNAVIQNLGIFGYRIEMVGSRLVVGAVSEDMLARAFSDLCVHLRAVKSGTYKGEYFMNSDYSAQKTTGTWENDIPTPDFGALTALYDAGDGTFVATYGEVSSEGYQAYIEKLKGSGYALADEYSLGGNLYKLLCAKSASVYVSRIASTSDMKVYMEKAGTAIYPDRSAPAAGGETAPVFWQLMSDYKGSGHNGGMSYVLKLSDGSFLVVDGGYQTEAEAKQLYDVLVANTPVGQKPVITAWFITHLHNDHYGCLLKFAEQYSDSVDVKGFYYNFAKTAIVSVSVLPKVTAAMSRWKNAVQYNKLHTGMCIPFAGAEAAVICTHEDYYPLTPYSENDTSLVIRLTVAGQRIMLLADAARAESMVMSATIPQSELKCDIVQIAHHGYEGCLRDLYEKIGAETAFWPMSIYGYKTDTVKNVFETWMKKGTSEKYAYPNSYLISSNSSIKKFFVDGAGTVSIALPYTPEGERLPDYRRIYAEIEQQESVNEMNKRRKLYEDQIVGTVLCGHDGDRHTFRLQKRAE